jgi:hypothetical protein
MSVSDEVGYGDRKSLAVGVQKPDQLHRPSHRARIIKREAFRARVARDQTVCAWAYIAIDSTRPAWQYLNQPGGFKRAGNLGILAWPGFSLPICMIEMTCCCRQCLGRDYNDPRSDQASKRTLSRRASRCAVGPAPPPRLP